MKKTFFSRKPLQVGVALIATIASLVVMPASAFAAKVGPGKYVVITQPLTLTLDCDDTHRGTRIARRQRSAAWA